MFALALIIIFIISFLLALLSLRTELKKPKEIKIAKEELMKEKVLFIKD
jgi:hypothetical protein